MADWISVLLLILCGVILIIIELIFVPGNYGTWVSWDLVVYGRRSGHELY